MHGKQLALKSKYFVLSPPLIHATMEAIIRCITASGVKPREGNFQTCIVIGTTVIFQMDCKCDLYIHDFT